MKRRAPEKVTFETGHERREEGSLARLLGKCVSRENQKGDSGMFKEQKGTSSEWNPGDKKRRHLEVLGGRRKDFQCSFDCIGRPLRVLSKK